MKNENSKDTDKKNNFAKKKSTLELKMKSRKCEFYFFNFFLFPLIPGLIVT